MSVFFDTNILVYAQQAGAKGDVARALMAEGGAVSVQVLNEFVNVAARKLGRSWREIDEAVSDILALVDPPTSLTLEINARARALAAAHGFSFYDALIVAAALASGCSTLLSEDMQHDWNFDGLAVVNPFR